MSTSQLPVQTAITPPREPSYGAPDFTDLLTKLHTQTAQLRALAKESTVTIPTSTIEALSGHDWDAYDSSDIHQRTQEWEAQARQATVIQHFTPKRKPITANQRAQANAALMQEMPGVQFGANLRQHKAHAMLVDFLGLDTANTIMAGE